MNQTLIIIRGLPGSGKSTLAAMLVRALRTSPTVPDWFEADDFFVNEDEEYHFDAIKLSEAHQWCQDMVKQSLQKGRTTIVSNTFTQRWEMEPYLKMAQELNIPVQIIECKGEFGSIHNVPTDVVNKMKVRWEEF